MRQVRTLDTVVANTYLVVGEAGLLLVDAGMPHRAGHILRKIRALGRSPQDLRLIFLTHGHIDHAGSAAALRRLTGAPIALYPGDERLVATSDLKIPPGRSAMIDRVGRFISRFGVLLPLEPFVPDIWLQDGQSLAEFGFSAQVVHSPGHTAGSTSFLFDDGTMFVGDAILNMVRVSFPLVWEDAGQAIASARKIQLLKPRLVYSGHGRPFDASALDRFVERYKRQGAANKVKLQA